MEFLEGEEARFAAFPACMNCEYSSLRKVSGLRDLEQGKCHGERLSYLFGPRGIGAVRDGNDRPPLDQ